MAILKCGCRIIDNEDIRITNTVNTKVTNHLSIKILPSKKYEDTRKPAVLRFKDKKISGYITREGYHLVYFVDPFSGKGKEKELKYSPEKKMWMDSSSRRLYNLEAEGLPI